MLISNFYCLHHHPAGETVPQRVASYSVIAVTTIITIVAARYILKALQRAKPAVIYERRKARFVPSRCRLCVLITYDGWPLFRQAKLELGASYYNRSESTLSAFNPNASDSEIPLQPYDPESEAGLGGPSHQQWDERGRAIGYTPDPRLHAPRPRVPSFNPASLYDPPVGAATKITSQGPEDEWTNADSPKTARPPDVAPIPVPTSADVTRDLYVPEAASAPAPAASFPSPPQSPRSGARQRTRSPQLSAEPQYATYRPEYFAENTAAISGAQYAYTTEPPLPPRGAFSTPPPGYQ